MEIQRECQSEYVDLCKVISNRLKCVKPATNFLWNLVFFFFGALSNQQKTTTWNTDDDGRQKVNEQERKRSKQLDRTFKKSAFSLPFLIHTMCATSSASFIVRFRGVLCLVFGIATQCHTPHQQRIKSIKYLCIVQTVHSSSVSFFFSCPLHSALF